MKITESAPVGHQHLQSSTLGTSGEAYLRIISRYLLSNPTDTLPSLISQVGVCNGSHGSHQLQLPSPPWPSNASASGDAPWSPPCKQQKVAKLHF